MAGVASRGRAVIVIPAFDPSSTLPTLVDRLSADASRSIIVVDDGSSAACEPIFLALVRPRVEVLRHTVNLGKGQALKTAFNHFLLCASADAPGVVTADADGKYPADDIRRVADHLEQQPSTLVLGRRPFEGDVPFRTRAGTVVTRALFRMLVGRPLFDPQTSLRGIPRSFIPELLEIDDGRYEFELAMLVRASARRVSIEEVPIATVEGRGLGSHFSPLRDSLRIYFVFFRFLALSIATAGLDFTLFLAAYLTAHNILAATAVARAGAGTFNFMASRTLVFRSRGGMAREALKYAALVVLLMGVSYGLVTSLVIFGGLGVYVSKLLAEGTLFAASFALQNLLVFPDREPARGKSARSAPGRTDWDAYYREPAAFAPVTRKITEWGILRDVRRFAGDGCLRHIAELGGGNSAFLAAFRRRFPDAHLSALDNNALGLSLLRSRLPGDPRLTLIETDVLAPVTNPLCADLVYSVGLVEHFDRTGTARAIGVHFAHVRPGGLVLITFPAPTLLYRLTRRIAERVGIWAFPDERPLDVREVANGIAHHGQVLGARINWAIVLTQGVIVARRSLLAKVDVPAEWHAHRVHVGSDCADTGCDGEPGASADEPSGSTLS